MRFVLASLDRSAPSGHNTLMTTTTTTTGLTVSTFTIRAAFTPHDAAGYGLADLAFSEADCAEADAIARQNDERPITWRACWVVECTAEDFRDAFSTEEAAKAFVAKCEAYAAEEAAAEAAEKAAAAA